MSYIAAVKGLQNHVHFLELLIISEHRDVLLAQLIYSYPYLLISRHCFPPTPLHLQVCGYVCAGFGLQQFSSAAQSTHERRSCLQRHHTGTAPPTLARCMLHPASAVLHTLVWHMKRILTSSVLCQLSMQNYRKASRQI